MKRLPLLLLLALTACGVRPSVPIEGGPAPTEEVTERTVLYFLHGTTLTRVLRPPVQVNPLELLAKGPTPEELAEGLTTEVPSSASPITVDVGENTITVHVSSPIKYLSPLAQSQLVCTVIPPHWPPTTQVILSDPDETLLPRTCPFDA
ncbi:hypothetical protein [Actinophytocola sp. NPDC049390]|uniref:hypothetical protein n=1 Tax=Actinophytocola sp. NPDC049390 TaxID=3363894 RepID=UPI00379B8A5D